MTVRSNLKLQIDWREEVIFLSAHSSGWGLKALSGSESSFWWPCLDAVIAWIKSDPGLYAFESFYDEAASEEENGKICAVVLGFLPDSVFFGYYGFENLWGGVTTLKEVIKVFNELARLRDQV